MRKSLLLCLLASPTLAAAQDGKAERRTGLEASLGINVADSSTLKIGIASPEFSFRDPSIKHRVGLLIGERRYEGYNKTDHKYASTPATVYGVSISSYFPVNANLDFVTEGAFAYQSYSKKKLDTENETQKSGHSSVTVTGGIRVWSNPEANVFNIRGFFTEIGAGLEVAILQKRTIIGESQARLTQPMTYVQVGYALP